jgi:UDP-N-acetylmuramoyl-L-alanyl-D-glutamate--2,6-diaminopimelate ligase
MGPRPLSDILAGLPVLEKSGGNPDVSSIVYDSRDAVPGSIFVAMDGVHTDGHGYVADAVRRGAAVVVHARPPAAGGEWPRRSGADQEVAYVRVENPRTFLSPLSAAFYGRPSRSLKVVGVTGTDGKSSTVWFIHQMLSAFGRKSGFLSTVGFQPGDVMEKNAFRQSTPEASEVQEMLRRMADLGKEYAVVEATSHGLSGRMNRLGDVAFDAAVLTNVTHEHQEFHGSFEQYRSDKANLFRALDPAARKGDPATGLLLDVPRFGVVSVDDPSWGYFIGCTKTPVYTYGMRGVHADLSAEEVSCDLSGCGFIMIHGGRRQQVRLGVPGIFQVENSLAAMLTVSTLLSVPVFEATPYCAGLAGVKGRMEGVDRGQPFHLIVDYAHTPGAFLKLMPWIRSMTPGRLIAVFGSAGERDRAKRPMQGQVASRYCDILVLTDEDPRGEDRQGILEDIAAGCAGKTRGEDLFLVADRPAAIRLAVAKARSGDTVLLLGKGHEGSILSAKGAASWDEREEAQKALDEAGFRS